jgi:hypothetical protein
MKRDITTILIAAAFTVLIFSFAADSDMQEQDRIQDEYCAMVEAGHWPDYKGNAKQTCTTTP